MLGVPVDADDSTIRRAYLEAIKSAPPDHDPRRFQTVSVAYEQIKDETSRHRYALFDHTPAGDSPLDALVRVSRLRRHHDPVPVEVMKAFLRSCAMK